MSPIEVAVPPPTGWSIRPRSDDGVRLCAGDDSVTESRGDHDGGELFIDPLAVKEQRFDCRFFDSRPDKRPDVHRFSGHHELLTQIRSG
jgi:hypothetical protein